MMDVLNLALPYFGLIFIGFACGKLGKLPETGLAWMNFFLLCVALPALFFRIMSRTPFNELDNLPFNRGS
jgi:malonate transporter and related proteins